MKIVKQIILLFVDLQRAALEACHKGWGVSTIIGVAAAGQGAYPKTLTRVWNTHTHTHTHTLLMG